MRTTCAAIVAFLAFTAPIHAADSKAKWDIVRTAAPETIDELKSLQDTVKAMVEKVTPATVGLFYDGGAGSGVIVSEDGLILTAAHVVSRNPFLSRTMPKGKEAPRPESRRVRVVMPDGTAVNGKVLGLKRGDDSAMVQIDKDQVPKDAKWPGADKGKWPFVELGKSVDLKMNQWVVSLGHPGGPKDGRRPPIRLGQMTMVSSEKNRIASDCTLVGGDSGGPIFDLAGKLIGIHTSIGNDLTQNYHIPTHSFQKHWDRMKRGDRIGDESDALTGFILKGKKDDRKVKPIIEEVKKGTPADNAGLQENDYVLELHGETVSTSEDVDQIMSGLRSGQKVTIKVRRGEDVYELEMTLGVRPKK